MKGLQDRNNLLLDGRAVENKGKLILFEIQGSGNEVILAQDKYGLDQWTGDIGRWQGWVSQQEG